MVDESTKLLLCIASALIALFSTIMAEMKNKNLNSYILPVSSFGSLLFTSNESINTRAQVLALLLITYFSFLFFFTLVAKLAIFIYHRIKLGKGNNTEERGSLKVILPENYEFIVDQKYIDDLPANIEGLTILCDNLEEHTRGFCENFPKCQSDEDRKTHIKAYFAGICYILASLFDATTRVHVRIFDGSAYIKYFATYDHRQEYHQTMKAMSYSNKMISKSYELKRSLIKSHNMNLHEEGSSPKWKNYLMFAIPQIVHKGKPVFSIGISIKRRRSDLFYFLNHCEIEAIIGRYIDRILDDENCHLAEAIEKLYFSSS